jgi:hypothetical protein
MLELTPAPTDKSFGECTWESFKIIIGKLWNFLRWLSPKTLGIVLAVVVVVGAILLISMGFKELQVGGLLGWLLGKKPVDGSRTIEVANTIDPKRLDKDGNIIPIGKPDSKGDTQAVVVPIQTPGLFSDPKTVIFTPPGADKPTEVVLPDGVTNKDVDQVIVVTPSVIVVTVKDSSGVPAQTVDDLLKKYQL